MPKISKLFKLQATQAELDFVDITTDRDTRLFLEPFAISIQDDAWSQHCQDHIISFFDAVVQAIRSGNDVRARSLLMFLSEPDETGLGYSTARGRGRGVRGEKADRLFRTLKRSRAVQTGLLTDLGEADLFVEGISLDGLSDITACVLRGPLIEYTQLQCANWGIDLRKNVAAGHVWDSTQQEWHPRYADLPIARGRQVILVPKFSVRRALLLNSQEYYSKHVIDFIRQEELRRGSGLVRLLKNGRREVYKKDVAAQNPFSKDFLARFSQANPEVLASYKKLYSALPNADGAPRDRDIDRDFDEALFARALVERLKLIPSGAHDATNYHKFMLGTLEFLFYPSLICPVAEQRLHAGRKRIDILYTNAGKSDFFSTALRSKQLGALVIPVECKNYSEDPKNPEFDQLAGRFSLSRGKLGFLCYRSTSDKALLTKRCADTAADDRGCMIPLGDADIIELLDLVAAGKRGDADVWLTRALNGIISGA